MVDEDMDEVFLSFGYSKYEDIWINYPKKTKLRTVPTTAYFVP